MRKINRNIKVLNYTLMEVLMVVVVVSFLMVLAVSSYNDMTKGQGVNIATRNLAGKLILARAHAVNNRQTVAILIPQCGGFPASDLPSAYYNRSYRACIVGQNGSNYYFKRWISGESWEFTPVGVAIFEVDGDNGVNTVSGKLVPVNVNPTLVSPAPLPALPPNKGIDCTDIGGGASVTGCAAIVFKPSGKSTGARFIEIGEGVYSSGSLSLVVTNPSANSFNTIHINQHTGRVSYEQAP
jgi:Tfp pilus assembly protein PilE